MHDFISIQYLRAIAALMVVAHHMFTTKLVDYHGETGWLAGGVDIFFVISGFIMVQSTKDRSYSPTQFYARRIIRIVPIYWLATFVVMMNMQWDWGDALKSLLFIPYLNRQTQSIMPVLQPGWTLNFEMFFYLIFGFSLMLPEKLRFYAVAACLIALVLIGLVLQPTGALGFYTRPIILEFILGMFIARFGVRLPFWLAPLALFAIPFLWEIVRFRELAIGLPAAIIVASLLTIDRQIPKLPFLSKLGDASYAIYLFHLEALGLLAVLVGAYAISPVIVLPAGLAIAALVGLAIHKFLETPINAILKNLYSQYLDNRQKAQLAT